MLLRLSISTVRRSTGRSACAAAAYRSAEAIYCNRSGRTYRYRSRRDRIIFSQLVAWTGTRQSLWNTAEVSEKRKDSVTARECLITLFPELTVQENAALALRFANYLRRRLGVAVDVCIHSGAVGPHAHLLFTTRIVNETGEFGQRTVLDDRYGMGPIAIREIREAWRIEANRSLMRAGEAPLDYPQETKKAVAANVASESQIPKPERTTVEVLPTTNRLR